MKKQNKNNGKKNTGIIVLVIGIISVVALMDIGSIRLNAQEIKTDSIIKWTRIVMKKLPNVSEKRIAFRQATGWAEHVKIYEPETKQTNYVPCWFENQILVYITKDPTKKQNAMNEYWYEKLYFLDGWKEIIGGITILSELEGHEPTELYYGKLANNDRNNKSRSK